MILFVLFIVTLAFIFAKALGGSELSFVGFALIFSGIMSFGSYYYSDQIVLASVHAQPIQKADNPELYRIVENLCIGSGIPMPKIYIMKEPAPNAFATGRDPKHGVVCVTTGLLSMMNKSELEGVIAHELSHIRNYDTRLMGIVAILVGCIVLMADLFMRNMLWRSFGRSNDRNNTVQMVFLVIGILFAILSPIIATLIQLSVSRKREYLADASGVLLTRYPEGLANALEKLKNDHRPTMSASNATAHLFIENPFEGKSQKTWFSSLFDTHPPIEERIKILRNM